MGDAHGRVGLVDVLAAGAAGPIGVDAQVVVADLDRGVLRHLRHDLHQREAGVPPLLRVERADPHQPVHAALALQPAVGPSAVDRERDALEARLLALGLVQDLGLEACCDRPSAGTCAAASPPSPAISVPPAPAWTDTIAGRSSYGSDNRSRGCIRLQSALSASRSRSQVGGQRRRRIGVGLGQLGDLGQARRRALRARARWRSPRAAPRRGAAMPARRSGRPRGRDRRSARSARASSVPWRASQRRTAVSATRRARRSASSLIPSNGRSPWGARPGCPLSRELLLRTLAGLTHGQ